MIDAISLSKTILDFEFVIALYTVERCLSFTEGLTRSLQGRAVDILKAVNHIGILKLVLTDARSDVDRQFHLIFESVSRFANKHNVSITTSRICSRQTARDNHPATSVEQYYRRSLAILFLDHLKGEIDNWFSAHSVLSLKCLAIIPTCFSSENTSTISDDEILDFFDIHCKSLTKADLQMWHTHFKDKEKLPDSTQSSLIHANPMIFLTLEKY